MRKLKQKLGKCLSFDWDCNVVISTFLCVYPSVPPLFFIPFFSHPYCLVFIMPLFIWMMQKWKKKKRKKLINIEQKPSKILTWCFSFLFSFHGYWFAILPGLVYWMKNRQRENEKNIDRTKRMKWDNESHNKIRKYL